MKEATALRLTIVLAVLTFGATLLGVSYNSLYADGEWFRAQYFGQDLFTMLIVIPFLVIGAQQGLNNNITAWRLIFLASLLYLIYVYAIFVFAAEFSLFYFLQLPVFSLSLFILLSLMGDFFISRRKIIMPGRTLRGLSATYLIFTAVMLSVLWLNDLLQHAFIQGHRSGTPTGEPLLVVYSLDLGIVIPLLLIATIGLMRLTTRGFAWTGIMLTLTTFMCFSLMAMSISAYYSGVQTDPFFIGLWTLLGMTGLVITILYMNRIQDALPENP